MRAVPFLTAGLLAAGLVAATPASATASAGVNVGILVSEVPGDSRVADQPVSYLVRVTAFTDGVRDVAFTLQLPAGATLVSTTPDPEVTCVGTRCTVPELAVYQAASVRLVLQPSTAGRYTVSAALEPRTPADTWPSNDTASASVDVTPVLLSSALSVAASPAVPAYGDAVRLSGVLRLAGGAVPPLASRSVYVASREAAAPAPSSWQPLGRVEADAQGRFSQAAGVARGPQEYRVSWLGDAEHLPAESSITVRPVLRPAVAMDPARVPPGGASSVVTVLTGPVAGRTLAVQRWTGSSWAALATRAVTGPGTVRVPAGRLAGGTHRFRAVLSGAGTVPSAQALLTASMWGRGDARAYRFLEELRPGVPMRWNPCAVIGYRVNLAQAPRGALADVAEALRRVTLASGLTFRYEGTTTHIPQDAMDPTGSFDGTLASVPLTALFGGLPKQPAALVLAWARRDQSTFLGSTAGAGGPQSLKPSASRQERYVQGAVVLDSTATFPAGFGAGRTVGWLLMHEIGHAVGLDHPPVAGQVMHGWDRTTDAAMWGAGDLTGLRKIGRAAGCIA